MRYLIIVFIIIIYRIEGKDPASFYVYPTHLKTWLWDRNEISRGLSIATGLVSRQYEPSCDRRTSGLWCNPKTEFSSGLGISQLPMKPLVVLDAGHGGGDEGTKIMAVQEKRIALITTLMTRQYLDQMGYSVILTRSRDVYTSLPRRVLIANQSKGVVFVSIHYNSAPNSGAKGIEIFYSEDGEPRKIKASKALANCILFCLLDQTGARSRGVKKAQYYVTRKTIMPAVLVEAGFLSNKEERNLLKKKEYLDKVAHGIASGVDKYLQSQNKRPRRELNARPAA